MIHEVKSWTDFYPDILAGRKTAEVRPNDRDYKVGDLMLLREWDDPAQNYTGRVCGVEITHVINDKSPCAVSNAALTPGYAVLSIKRVGVLK